MGLWPSVAPEACECVRVCVRVLAYLCFCVSLYMYIKKGNKIENERERAVAVLQNATVFVTSLV